MPRTRTTKKLAQRIDLQYFRRPTAFRRARFWLALLLPAAAVAWIAWRGLTGDSHVYSSGKMSRKHAVLEKQCAVCHVMKAGAYSAKAENAACLSCHDGPIHHENQVFTPNCTMCHVEHRGAMRLATSNRSCAECHADLKSRTGVTQFASHIETLEDSHTEFAAIRERRQDQGTIKLNHAIHMKPIRRGPGGPTVQLECGDCHRAEAVRTEWTYSDAHYTSAKPSYAEDAEPALPVPGVLRPPRAPSGRELMVRPKFATACAGCHLLEFDKQFAEGVPHDKPQAVQAFIVKKFQEYIAAHPAELRMMREPQRNLTGKPLPPSVRVLTPAQWVQEKTAEAAELLWRKTCKQCHALDFAPGASLPRVEDAKITARWMPHAKFDHDAHRGFSCTSCHAAALNSAETSDVLLPGIATCQKCHAPGEGHAESRCYECHTYHDWSKRKEVRPTFTLPSLATGR